MDVVDLIHEYRGQLDKVVFPYVSSQYIRETLAKQYGEVGTVPAHVLSWKLMLHSLETTYTISLGRIFDSNPDSLSVEQFLLKCKTQLDEFSRDAFEKRRMFGKTVAPEFLANMLATATPPTEADFESLIAYAAQAADLAKPFKKIRNKVTAHFDFKHINKHEELYGNATLADFEEVCKMLDQILVVVQRAYDDCQWVDVSVQERDREHYILAEVKPFLAPLFVLNS